MERIIFLLIVAIIQTQCCFAGMDIPTDKIDKLNKDCYDKRAAYWDRFPFERHIPQMINDLYNPTLGNRVLDIGSGTGILAEWMQRKGFDVLCLDPSDEMVDRCRKKGLNIRQARIQDFHSNDQYAIIFAVLSLIHVPKKEFSEQLDKIAAMLPENGLLILGMIGGTTEGVEEKLSGYPRFFAKYTMAELEALTAHKFEVTQKFTFDGPVQYLLLSLKKSKLIKPQQGN
jgi:2-polyprenyl-3-methyl-5-hydroxy-6-metoxy-1,4-benzoquinol methylase